MKTMVPAISIHSLAVPAISILLILILINSFLRWKSSKPSNEVIMKALKERIALLQEKLTLLIARLSWTTPQEQEIKSRHRGLTLTSAHLLFTKASCDQMLDYLAKAIAYYPEDLRQEVGGVEAAENLKRVKNLKDKQRSLRGKSADQTAKTIKPEDWR